MWLLDNPRHDKSDAIYRNGAKQENVWVEADFFIGGFDSRRHSNSCGHGTGHYGRIQGIHEDPLLLRDDPFTLELPHFPHPFCQWSYEAIFSFERFFAHFLSISRCTAATCLSNLLRDSLRDCFFFCSFSTRHALNYWSSGSRDNDIEVRLKMHLSVRFKCKLSRIWLHRGPIWGPAGSFIRWGQN